MRKEKLYAMFSKCEFWLDFIAFLGHMVTKYGMIVTLAKVEVICDWVRPTSMIEI